MPGARLRFILGGGGVYLEYAVGNQCGDLHGFPGLAAGSFAAGDYSFARSGRVRLGLTTRYYVALPEPDLGDRATPIGSVPRGAARMFVLGPALTFAFP
jgi:hypothetical protein